MREKKLDETKLFGPDITVENKSILMITDDVLLQFNKDQRSVIKLNLLNDI